MLSTRDATSHVLRFNGLVSVLGIITVSDFGLCGFGCSAEFNEDWLDFFARDKDDHIVGKSELAEVSATQTDSFLFDHSSRSKLTLSRH